MKLRENWCTCKSPLTQPDKCTPCQAADLIAALRAEIKTAQNWCAIHKANAEKAEAELQSHLHLDNHNSIVRNLQEQIKNVEAECERLREDAERYRWVRNNVQRRQQWPVTFVLAFHTPVNHGSFDEYVDFARGRYAE